MCGGGRILVALRNGSLCHCNCHLMSGVRAQFQLLLEIPCAFLSAVLMHSSRLRQCRLLRYPKYPYATIRSSALQKCPSWRLTTSLPAQQKKSYKDITSPQTSHDVEEVINPTYSPIDWETKMEQVQEKMVRECTQQTKQLIEASDTEHQKQIHTLRKTIESHHQ